MPKVLYEKRDRIASPEEAAELIDRGADPPLGGGLFEHAGRHRDHVPRGVGVSGRGQHVQSLLGSGITRTSGRNRRTSRVSARRRAFLSRSRSSLPWSRSAFSFAAAGPGRELLPDVRFKVAVASAKGGVGKSTVTANLKPGTYTGLFPFDDNDSWAKNTAGVWRY